MSSPFVGDGVGAGAGARGDGAAATPSTRLHFDDPMSPKTPAPATGTLPGMCVFWKRGGGGRYWVCYSAQLMLSAAHPTMVWLSSLDALVWLHRACCDTVVDVTPCVRVMYTGRGRTPGPHAVPLSTSKTPRGLAAAASAAAAVSGACSLAQLTTPRLKKASRGRGGTAPGEQGDAASAARPATGPRAAGVLSMLSINFDN
jgi:hypothetical protein